MFVCLFLLLTKRRREREPPIRDAYKRDDLGESVVSLKLDIKSEESRGGKWEPCGMMHTSDRSFKATSNLRVQSISKEGGRNSKSEFWLDEK